MRTEATNTPAMSPLTTSVVTKMLNVFVSPTLVFDEVMTSAPSVINCLVPTVLACVSSLFLLEVSTTSSSVATAISQWVDVGAVSPTQTQVITAHWPAVSRIATGLAVLLGTFWSAMALWVGGRLLLKGCFEFVKALEVASLSATILVLAGVVTGLLVLATGDASARPSLSLFCSGLPPETPLRGISEVFNVFYLWVAAVLALGLARLSRVRLKEAAFWVFGFWIFGRISMLILA